MIIDFHVHCGLDLDGKKASTSDLEKQARHNGISRMAVFPFNTPDLINESLRILRESEKMSRHNGIFAPFLRFDPNSISKDELAGLLEMGFKGVKLHPRSQNFNPADKKHRWVFEEISKHNKPVLIHTRTCPREPQSHPSNVVRLSRDFPEQIFVIGHNCGGDKHMYGEILDFDNVYVETSVCSSTSDFEFAHEQLGFDRFVFGSDFPYSLPEIELLKIKKACIPEDVKKKILWRNGKRIIG